MAIFNWRWIADPITDEAQEAEAVQVLNAILDIREHTPSDPVEIVKILHALAMLQFVFKNLAAVSKILTVHADEIIGHTFSSNDFGT